MKENVTLTKLTEEQINECVSKTTAKTIKDIMIMTITANGDVYIQDYKNDALSFTIDYNGNGLW